MIPPMNCLSLAMQRLRTPARIARLSTSIRFLNNKLEQAESRGKNTVELSVLQAQILLLLLKLFLRTLGGEPGVRDTTGYEN